MAESQGIAATGEPYLKTIKLDDVVLPEGDDMGIPSEDEEEEEEEELRTESGFGNVIVVDNLPQIGQEKCDKLLSVLKKIFSQFGEIRDGGLCMPMENSKTKGYAFVEYMDAEMAAAALKTTDGYKLDKAHVFKVNMFDDFEKFDKTPDDYVAPLVKEYKPREHLQHWMMDERGRDQFAIRWADETEVYWNDAGANRSEEVYRRSFWTESYVQWSPRGSMLTTVHRQGVAVWGGPNWNRLLRFSHPGVQLLDFSPCENYMMTCSTQDSHTREPAKVCVKVFEMRSGTMIREFNGPITEFVMEGDRQGLNWPVFKWGGGEGDKYFARMSKNQITVYETPEMTVLDKKSLKLEGVQEFEWCPSSDILSVYQPEIGNQPARISLVAIPSKKEIRQKNLFSVSEIKMYWHSSGSYLAVRVDRYTKTKKSTYTGFELFRVNEKECPMEVLELENKSEKIVAFAWEPKGHRFAIIHGDGPRPDITFYTMQDKLGRVKKIGTLKGKSANQLYWSPQGKNIILAGLKSLNGQLEFFNVDEFETMATTEHFMCTDVNWDPTGRYVSTSVTSMHQMENGFNMWSFNGRLLYRTPRDRFFQFLWRPRIPSLLSEEQEEEIKRNLKSYSKKYDSIDEELKLIQDSADMEEKRALLDEWNAWRQRKVAQYEEERVERERLVAHLNLEGEDECSIEEVTVEEIQNINEEILSM
uniref:Eukaryotic translation initiation factor 3 subunit B n=1 Tax=Pyramimonas obovata TaxID=1411642 RepID=A0A7S0RNS6_9CHLO|eukprot:CAMPEP_0118934566 /NCGR_PEP_ID=MMETSP1169-20130426/13894_1 /TAXON_ID=36882 /ORGANISM="Pyramimonas obovata, Strain CCMP722" /LENGTH=698 /DNA_ID=CAMNT_0006877485 /DNA_START=37 /DNA_END=2133 /DNA_ORIENTATION=+